MQYNFISLAWILVSELRGCCASGHDIEQRITVKSANRNEFHNLFDIVPHVTKRRANKVEIRYRLYMENRNTYDNNVNAAKGGLSCSSGRESVVVGAAGGWDSCTAPLDFSFLFFWTSLAPLPALRESSHGNTYSDHNACSLVDGSQPSEFQRWKGLMMPLDLRCWERQNFQQFRGIIDSSHNLSVTVRFIERLHFVQAMRKCR